MFIPSLQESSCEYFEGLTSSLVRLTSSQSIQEKNEIYFFFFARAKIIIVMMMMMIIIIIFVEHLRFSNHVVKTVYIQRKNTEHLVSRNSFSRILCNVVI